MTVTIAQRAHTRQLFATWLIAAALMLIGYFVDRSGSFQDVRTQVIGLHDMGAEDTLLWSMKRSFLELVVLFCILRPWTFTVHTRYRALLALILFLPYSAVSVLLGPGGEFSRGIYVLWLLGVLLMLLLATAKPIEAAVAPEPEKQRP